MEQKSDIFPLPEMQNSSIQGQRDEKVLQWGNSFQFSTPLVIQTKPRKGASGKIRAKWSNKARYNPMKMKRSNTLDLPVTNMDTMHPDKVKATLSVKVCDRFGPMCQFCKQSPKVRLDGWRLD